MPPTSFPITITVKDTDGSTLLTGVQVNVRNETNDEVESETTDGSGQVIINLGNMATQWIEGDVITQWVVNGSDFKSEQFTIASAQVSKTTTLTLIDGSTTGATQLRYFTVGEFREHYCLANYNANTNPGVPKDNQIQRIGIGVEAQIDEILTQKFDNNNGALYTATEELHDTHSIAQMDYYSRFAPIQEVTKFEINTSTIEGTKSYTDLVAEGENLWEVDKETGRFRVEKDRSDLIPTNLRFRLLPLPGANQVRLSYTYGSTTVPEDIKRLAILWTGRDLGKGNLMRLSIVGTEMERNAGIDVIGLEDKEIDMLINARLRRNVINV